MNESNLRTCKICDEIKVRISDGKFPNNSTTRYKDDNGKQWMGRTCPDCHKIKIATNQRVKRHAVSN